MNNDNNNKANKAGLTDVPEVNAVPYNLVSVNHMVEEYLTEWANDASRYILRPIISDMDIGTPVDVKDKYIEELHEKIKTLEAEKEALKENVHMAVKIARQLINFLKREVITKYASDELDRYLEARTVALQYIEETVPEKQNPQEQEPED